jgi:hypothetical protein
MLYSLDIALNYYSNYDGWETIFVTEIQGTEGFEAAKRGGLPENKRLRLTMRVNSRPQPRAEKSAKVLRVRACGPVGVVAPQKGRVSAVQAKR